jgi:hypothetical protein
MKQLILSIACIFCLVDLPAQTDTVTTPTSVHKKTNYFGVNAGFTTGLGLSYIYRPNRNAIQVTFLPLFDKEANTFSFALTYLRYFSHFKKGSFFMFIGNHLTNIGADRPQYFLGIGPGIEGGTEKDALKVHFMVGYGILNIPDNYMTRPIIEFGVYHDF